jgi:hypothetical protein
MSDRAFVLGWAILGILVMAMIMRMFLGSEDEPPSFW